MKLSDVNIIYINLEKRSDRLLNITGQLQKLDILYKSILIKGIDGQSFTKAEESLYLSDWYSHPFSKIKARILGRIGCTLSHFKALEYAILHEFDNVLILEDDCQFVNDAINTEINPPTDCDIFYLGGYFWIKIPEETYQTGNWVNIKNKHFKIACTFAYGIIGKDKILKIYEILKKSRKETIDLMYIRNLQKLGNSYIINPVIALHNTNFTSDVTNLGGTIKSIQKKKSSYFYEPILETNG